MFEEPHGQEPRIIHEMWDSNMHLMKFSKTLRAGQAYGYAVAGTAISSAHHADPLNEAERLTIFRPPGGPAAAAGLPPKSLAGAVEK